ncbi:MAG: UDP-N-acetylglucosamine 2-epimerase (non-hydrolyzing) [Bacteroidetes bacterium]|nr:UDP-N-acetylglucosamine 2-epimerase (non-hydrolyzing) [Bacteroidota bacterium]
MKKIFTIVGARPQFVKAAVVSRVIHSTPDIEEILVHTGQHFDKNMSDIFFEEMEIPKPNYSLGINSMSHGQMTGAMLGELEKLMLEEKPDTVLVYGDTNSTLAGALAAIKLHIPIAHVEAGLRSFNMQMPEEINRILTDRVSTWLFCPTQTAVDNLKTENFSNGIYLTGDVMFDAARYYYPKRKRPEISGIQEGEYILGTIHREENTKNTENLKRIIDAINHVHQNIKPVVVPMHPGTMKKIKDLDIRIDFHMIPPVSYFEMIWLIDNCKLVVTDSGGLQKEAYFFNKFCVTMREQTEWIELVENGVNKICGTDSNMILDAIGSFMTAEFKGVAGIYGDAHAGSKIIAELLK